MFSWRHHPLRYVAREDELAYSRLYDYIEQLADSVSGLVSTPSFNQFLLESCQLLANSLDLIHQGYFDAAFYSVRQAGEVILIGTLFSNLEESERKAKYEKWVSLDRFPSFSELSKMLRSKDIEYRDLLEQMPEIDELISKLNKRANKYIHKQGHESFYTKPYEVVSESARRIREDFTVYFKTTVKVCSIFRLAVDPFPILLNDPEEINAVVRGKKPQCESIVYCPPEKGRIDAQGMKLLSMIPFTALCNFRGRMVNDVLLMMLSTSFKGKDIN